MALADARHLLLQGREALELRVGDVREVIGAVRKLPGEVRQRAETVNEIGELLLDLGRWVSGWRKATRLNGLSRKSLSNSLAWLLCCNRSIRRSRPMP